MYEWSSIKKQIHESTTLELHFQKGVPVALNGTRTDFVELIALLNQAVGAFGHGRYMGFEELEGGTKFLEFREMPAAHLLLDAYRKIESATLSSETIREKMHIEQIWVREAIEGRWFDPLKRACQSFIEATSEKVTGVISYQIGVGSLEARKIKVERPVYGRSREDYEMARLDSGMREKSLIKKTS